MDYLMLGVLAVGLLGVFAIAGAVVGADWVFKYNSGKWGRVYQCRDCDNVAPYPYMYVIGKNLVKPCPKCGGADLQEKVMKFSYRGGWQEKAGDGP